jgi:NAD(P)-dependent dehydrogenase (short-subunit alcohol dehydrogenase family)
MPTDLAGKVVLVTGAARRIGRAIALEMAGRGAKVAVHFRSSAREADEVVGRIRDAGGTAQAFRADLTEVLEIQQMARAIEVDLGYVDVLVNNASEFFETPLSTASDADWERMLAVNLRAPFQLARRIAPTMENRGGGVIVNVVDLYGEKYLRRHLAYCVSKAGLVMLTRGLARELAPTVRVNAVSPGTVLFPEDYTEERRDALRRTIPLGREGTPDDVVRAVLYLVTDAPYVTGEVLRVDGGKGA